MTINKSVTTELPAVTECDEYYWEVTDETYTDSELLTYTYDNGASNGCDSVVTLNLTVNTLPDPPSTITGTATVCAGTAELNYSVTNVSGMTYEWELPSGWTKTGGGTSNSITVTAGTSGGTISVKATNSNNCTSTTASTKIVTVNARPATPSAIEGDVAVCAGTTGLIYSVTNVAGMTYEWTLSGGLTQTGGGISNSITVTAGTSGGTISVKAKNSNNCTSTTASIKIVTVNARPATPSAIEGDAAVCAGTTGLTYYVTNVSGMTYEWTLPIGWTQTGGGISNSITVMAGTSGGTISVKAKNSNNCTSTTASTMPVTVNTPPTAPTSISVSDTIICQGTDITLKAEGGSEGDGCTYEWGTDVCGISVIPKENESIYNVTPLATTTYWVHRIGRSPCENDTTGCAQIKVTVNNFSTVANIISRDTTVCSGSSVKLNDLVTATGVNSPEFKWYSTVNGTTELTNLTVIPPVGTHTYYVSVKGSNFCEGAANATGRKAVSVTVAANITQNNPNPTTICYNTTHTFDLAPATSGIGTITYQWQQSTDSTNWHNAQGINTNATYTTPELTNDIYYRRQATNTCGGTINSDSALVTILPSPSIFVKLKPNSNILYCCGDTEPEYVYQWGVNGTIIDTSNHPYCKFETINENNTYFVNVTYSIDDTKSECTKPYYYPKKENSPLEQTPSCSYPDDTPTNPNKIFLYPNPAQNELNIEVEIDIINADISIVEITGKVVLQSKITGRQSKIDIARLKAGFYILLLKTEKTLLTAKFIVE